MHVYAQAWENFNNKSISSPTFTSSPAPISHWLLAVNVPPKWSVIGPLSCPSQRVPGFGFGQQRRAAASLFYCSVRRSAEGSGLCASCCVRLWTKQQQQRAFSSSRPAGIPRSSRACSANGRGRILFLSFWLIEAYISSFSLMITNTVQPETCGLIRGKCIASR